MAQAQAKASPRAALPRPATEYWTEIVPHDGLWVRGKSGRDTVVMELLPDEPAADRPANAAGIVIRCAATGPASYRYVASDRFAAVERAACRRAGL